MYIYGISWLRYLWSQLFFLKLICFYNFFMQFLACESTHSITKMLLIVIFSSEATLEMQISVRMSVNHVQGETSFSRPLIEISLQFFCLQIPLINEHLFCTYFVRLSVGNATKGFATYGCFHPCFIYILANFAALFMVLIVL